MAINTQTARGQSGSQTQPPDRQGRETVISADELIAEVRAHAAAARPSR
jgi:hypothetical protein